MKQLSVILLFCQILVATTFSLKHVEYKTETKSFIENETRDTSVQTLLLKLKGEWSSTADQTQLQIYDSTLIWIKNDRDTIRYIFQINDVVEAGTDFKDHWITLFKEGTKTPGNKKADELLCYSIQELSDNKLVLIDFRAKIDFGSKMKNSVPLKFEKTETLPTNR